MAKKIAKVAPPPPHPIRDTLFLILILVIFTLATRVFLVEAYAIPTGSMAPTLLGRHRHAHCPACGYEFDVEAKGRRPLHCPLCKTDLPMPGMVLEGDRLLVSKLPIRPNRWDVVVFRNPQTRDPINNGADAPGPNSFFIKRVVGLPGEDIHLLDGHVFVRKPGEGEFHIARRADPKTNPHWEAIARTAWRPIAKAADTTNWSFDFDRADGEKRPAYDDATLHPYNQPGQGFKHRAEETIEDLRLAGTSDGSAATLGFDTAFEDARQLTLALSADGHLRLLGNGQTLEQTGLPARQALRLELWLLDHEALAFANGQCVLRHAFDLSWAQVLARHLPPHPARIFAKGKLKDLALDSALPYLSEAEGRTARGGITRDTKGRAEQVSPVTLPDGTSGAQACWFCLGDNSPASTDSRFWDDIHPQVQAHLLDGHAFEGLVPEGLMVGRAHSVAWPADEGGARWKPQLGKVRRIR